MPKKGDPKILKGPFEDLLKEFSLHFDPKDGSFTITVPSLTSIKLDSILRTSSKEKSIVANQTINESNKPSNSEKSLISKDQDMNDSTKTMEDSEDEYHDVDLEDDEESSDSDILPGFSELDMDIKPIRVRIHLEAYLKMALHALKYANPKVKRKNWIEVIGLLVGSIENKDTPLARIVVTDAYPVGHGTSINAQIQNPQSLVRVYQSKRPGTQIVGWYHSHPSYGFFMSDTDYHTQVRYQRLARTNSQVTAPIGLVIDPTRISSRSYGFKIFRLKENLKDWEEPSFEVLNCPMESVPSIIAATLPLAEGKAMFLEYDYEDDG
ncbi:MAG: Mov34/MPN/PAD-1 family protein [Candidatus Hodarchaeota archaeon]